MPKSLQRWVTSLSVSSKVSSSSRNSMRSRADILPSLCCFSRRCSPPPSSARWSRFFSSASFCSRFMRENYSGLGRMRIADQKGKWVGRRARRPSSMTSQLLHAGAEWHVLVSLAIEEDHRGGLIAAGLFGEDSHDRPGFLYRHLLHHDLLEGHIHDEELRFGHGAVPSFRTRPVNDQQRVTAPLRSFRRKLRGDFGIAVAKKAVVGVDDHEAVFGLVHHRIGAFCRDDDIFDAIAVQISHEGLKPDQRAGRTEFFLYEVVVNGRLGRRKHGHRLRRKRTT